MRSFRLALILGAVVALGLVGLPTPAAAQNSPTIVSFSTPLQAPNSPVTLVGITATAAVNNATTLTIPAPPGGQYNYVCYLGWEVGQDATGTTAQTDSVTTSTNFNSFAFKFSIPATANLDTGILVGINALGVGGCPKSAAAGTATTFIGPTANLHATQTWYAVYYQAP